MIGATVGRSDIELSDQPFSKRWVIASVFLITGMELAIALLLAPAILTGRLASPMVQMRMQMIMHLASFYFGGILVGLISPRVRIWEPAVGAFVSVALVFLMSFFMPSAFMHFDLGKIVVGGGIAFVLALAGAYTGERWMGNVERDSARGRLRERMWGERGLLSRGDERFLLRRDR